MGLPALMFLSCFFVFSTQAHAATGDLVQKAGLAGCISEDGTGGECTDGIGMGDAYSVVISPDGKNAYAASSADSTIAIFDRDATTGELTQKAGAAGCIADDNTVSGRESCADGVGLDTPRSITISPDGRNAYVTSDFFSYAVTIFDRDTSTGELTQKAGDAGCIADGSNSSDLADCAEGVGLHGARSVTVSPDGKSAYIASRYSDAVAVFDRNTTTGVLTQKGGTDACISEDGSGGDCADGVALNSAVSVTVSPDGKNAYVASSTNGGIAIFDRDSNSGSLTQKAGTAGCVSQTGGAGDPIVPGVCADGTSIHQSVGVTVSPDGKNIYVASSGSDAVAIFDRDSNNGSLTQKAGTDGCISRFGSSGDCTDGTGLADASSITISPDGQSAYVTALSDDAVAVFDRDSGTGNLVQKSGTDACVSDTGGTAAGSPGDCADGVALEFPRSVSLSPDGENAYVAASVAGAIAIFDRADGTPPAVTIDSAPPTPGNDPTPTFSFSADEQASFECRVHVQGTVAPGYEPCSGPGETHTPGTALADGDWTFEVRATDGGANASTATVDFSLDSTAPVVTIASPVNGATIGTDSISVAFTADGPVTGFECRLDTAPFEACGSPAVFNDLEPGTRTIEVRASDDVGNTGTAAVSFTVAPASSTACQTAQADLKKAKSKLGKANSQLKQARKKVNNASKSLKRAKKSGKAAKVRKSKKKLTKLNKKLKAAKKKASKKKRIKKNAAAAVSGACT
ncbi:MAG: beta-propeller fold lactonase family protein [Solirubrobacterales bacterium]